MLRLSYYAHPDAADDTPITVRLVDGCGNSRLAQVRSSAIKVEWFCDHTERFTPFVPYHHVTDGNGRPVWVPEGTVLAPKMRPIEPVAIEDDPTSAAWWRELETHVTPYGDDWPYPPEEDPRD